MKRRLITTAILSLASIVAELNPVLIRKPYYEMDGGIWFKPLSADIHSITTIAITKRHSSFGGAYGIQIVAD